MLAAIAWVVISKPLYSRRHCDSTKFIQTKVKVIVDESISSLPLVSMIHLKFKIGDQLSKGKRNIDYKFICNFSVYFIYSETVVRLFAEHLL